MSSTRVQRGSRVLAWCPNLGPVHREDGGDVMKTMMKREGEATGETNGWCCEEDTM